MFPTMDKSSLSIEETNQQMSALQNICTPELGVQCELKQKIDLPDATNTLQTQDVQLVLHQE